MFTGLLRQADSASRFTDTCLCFEFVSQLLIRVSFALPTLDRFTISHFNVTTRIFVLAPAFLRILIELDPTIRPASESVDGGDTFSVCGRSDVNRGLFACIVSIRIRIVVFIDYYLPRFSVCLEMSGVLSRLTVFGGLGDCVIVLMLGLGGRQILNAVVPVSRDAAPCNKSIGSSSSSRRRASILEPFCLVGALARPACSSSSLPSISLSLPYKASWKASPPDGLAVSTCD